MFCTSKLGFVSLRLESLGRFTITDLVVGDSVLILSAKLKRNLDGAMSQDW